MAKAGNSEIGATPFAIYGHKWASLAVITRSGTITSISKYYSEGNALKAKVAVYNEAGILLCQSETVDIPQAAGWYNFPLPPTHIDPQQVRLAVVENDYVVRSRYDAGGSSWRVSAEPRKTPDNEFTDPFGVLDWSPQISISMYATYTPDVPVNYNLTVDSVPSGIPVAIDTVNYSTPVTLSLPEGDHLIAFAKENGQFFFLEYSDGVKDNVRVINLDRDISLTANYGQSAGKCQYRGMAFFTRVENDSVTSKLMGRMENPAYYIPKLDELKDKWKVNLIRSFMFFLEDSDTRWNRNVNHTLETTAQIDAFLTACADRGIAVVMQLFVYPYGDGHWYDWDNMGYFNPENYDMCKAWLNSVVEPFKNDPRVTAWNVINEPYWRTLETSGVNEKTYIRDFTVEMAIHLKDVIGVTQAVTFGSLHPYNEYNSPVGSQHATADKTKVVDFFDIVSFHAYGAQNPTQSYGDPETVDPETLTAKMITFGKPVINSEFGTPTAEGCTGYPTGIDCQKAYIEACLNAAAKYGILATIAWGWEFNGESYVYNIETAEGLPTEAGQSLIDIYTGWIEPDQPPTGDTNFLLVFLGVCLLLVLASLTVTKKER